MATTRQTNVDDQGFASLPFTLPTISATTTCALFTAPRPFRIDSIELISDATYTQDAANVYSLAVLLAACGGVLAACGGGSGSVPTGDAKLFTVKRDDLPITVRENAELQALQARIAQFTLRLPHPGARVERVEVRRAGTVLASRSAAKGDANATRPEGSGTRSRMESVATGAPACASPVSAAADLANNLWRLAAGAVLTSATLRSLGSFDLLLAQTGLKWLGDTECVALESPFDFQRQGELYVPAMRASPKDAP